MDEDPAVTQGYIVTFENYEGIEVNQTDVLTTYPSAQLLGHIITTSTDTDMDLTATTAITTQVTMDGDGNIIDSEIVCVVFTVSFN